MTDENESFRLFDRVTGLFPHLDMSEAWSMADNILGSQLSYEHGNHDEQRVEGCPDCDREQNEEFAEYAWMAAAVRREPTRAEREEMESDRELMLDEFHQ